MSVTGLWIILVLVCSVSGGSWSNWTEDQPSCELVNLSTNKCSSLENRSTTCQRTGDGECSDCERWESCIQYSCYTSCCDGFRETGDAQCVSKATPIECENGGTPMKDNVSEDWVCTCLHGYKGFTCEKMACNCWYGICEVHGDTPICVCEPGYTGDQCETELDSTSQYNNDDNSSESMETSKDNEKQSQDDTFVTVAVAGGAIAGVVVGVVVVLTVYFRKRHHKGKSSNNEQPVDQALTEGDKREPADVAVPMLPQSDHQTTTT